jgi:hypothetical protein
MPSTVEIQQQATSEAECSAPAATNPLTRPPLAIPAELRERKLQEALDQVHDVELLCGVER